MGLFLTGLKRHTVCFQTVMVSTCVFSELLKTHFFWVDDGSRFQIEMHKICAQLQRLKTDLENSVVKVCCKSM